MEAPQAYYESGFEALQLIDRMTTEQNKSLAIQAKANVVKLLGLLKQEYNKPKDDEKMDSSSGVGIGS